MQQDGKQGGREGERLQFSCLALTARGPGWRPLWHIPKANTTKAPGSQEKTARSRGIPDVFQSHQLVQEHPAHQEHPVQAEQPLSCPGRLLQRHQQTPGTALPETLGVGLQEKPPLDWSVSPKSYVSLGLGLYSRLGREEASLILGQGEETWIKCNKEWNRRRSPRRLCSWVGARGRKWSADRDLHESLCWKVGLPRGLGSALGEGLTSQVLLRNAQEFRPAEDTRAVVLKLRLGRILPAPPNSKQARDPPRSFSQEGRAAGAALPDPPEWGG